MSRPLCSPSWCDKLKNTREAQKGTGPGERIDIYLDTAGFQAAEGDITFQVNDLNQLSCQPA